MVPQKPREESVSGKRDESTDAAESRPLVSWAKAGSGG